MNLPDTYRGPDGLTVEGASPDLLAALLECYEGELADAGVPVREMFAEPIPRVELEATFIETPLTLTDELTVWWGWHDGIRQDFHRALSARYHFLPANQALRKYADSQFGSGESFTWNPAWLKLSADNVGFAVRCEQAQPPLVRFLSPTGGSTAPDDTESQVVSLCTPVTWWILSIREGWATRRPDRDGWGEWELDPTKVPLEWMLTFGV